MSLRKRIIVITSLIIIFMLIIPLIVINTVKADAGMLVTLLFFFAVYPVVAVWIGFISGKDIKHLWYNPILIAVLFWVFSSFSYRTVFTFVYSFGYFFICLLSMIIVCFIKK